jgi:hypothetical protein
VDDIYFITRFSHHGEVVNLKSRGVEGGMTMEPTPNQGDQEPKLEYHRTCSYTDLGVSLVTLGIKATHVLWWSVYNPVFMTGVPHY